MSGAYGGRVGRWLAGPLGVPPGRHTSAGRSNVRIVVIGGIGKGNKCSGRNNRGGHSGRARPARDALRSGA